MLEFIRGKVSNRKLRLFAVACCRRVWKWLPKYSRKAVEVAELYADKKANRRQMSQARRAVVEKGDLTSGWDGSLACGWFSAAWAVWEAATGAARTARIAPKPPAWVKAASTKRPTEAMQRAAGMAYERTRQDEAQAQCAVLRDLFTPFYSVEVDNRLLTSVVLTLAQQMYESRDFSPMPILADALLDAGCEAPEILAHCRGPGPHTRGCFVVDAVLGQQ
jgi:hypothetical protein